MRPFSPLLLVTLFEGSAGTVAVVPVVLAGDAVMVGPSFDLCGNKKGESRTSIIFYDHTKHHDRTKDRHRISFC